jgi:hypothetical protein
MKDIHEFTGFFASISFNDIEIKDILLHIALFAKFYHSHALKTFLHR